MMHIAFCTDDNYSMPCGIAIVSLLENNRGEDITIHLLGCNLNTNNQKLLKETADKYKIQILFYDIKEKDLEKFQLSTEGPQYISISTFIRLFLAEIISESIPKILYLDCDLMVTGKLNELWNTNINNYSIGGVIEFLTFKAETFKNLKYPDEYAYINAGVLLINLKYWRENNVLNKFSEYAENNKANIKFLDQDIINGTLYASTLLLPIKYNTHMFFFERKTNAYQYQEEMYEAQKNPVIVHFTSASKPWNKGSLHPLTSKYIEYKNISLWKNIPLTWGDIPLKKKLKYYKRIILYSLGLKVSQFIKV